jgi:hypothetical protein
MKRIYAKAIELADSTLIKEKLVNVVHNIKHSEYAERFLDVLFDADVKESELPLKTQYCDEIRTRIDFDYLEDRVFYSYTKVVKRWFINEEDAIEYAKSGKYNYNTSDSSKKEGYNYVGEYTRSGDSHCNLYEWMDSKPITEE